MEHICKLYQNPGGSEIIKVPIPGLPYCKYSFDLVCAKCRVVTRLTYSTRKRSETELAKYEILSDFPK